MAGDEEEISDAATLSREMAQLAGVEIDTAQDFHLPKGDWRTKGGRHIITTIIESPTLSTEFTEWHKEWYNALVFGDITITCSAPKC